MARVRMIKADLTALAERLEEVVRTVMVTSWEGFARRVRVASSTCTGWKNKKNAPDTAALIRIARASGVSLDWLLLGEGPELREAPESMKDFAKLLRRVIVAIIASREFARSSDVEASLPAADDLFAEVVLERQLAFRRYLADAKKNARAIKGKASGRRRRLAMKTRRQGLPRSGGLLNFVLHPPGLPKGKVKELEAQLNRPDDDGLGKNLGLGPGPE